MGDIYLLLVEKCFTMFTVYCSDPVGQQETEVHMEHWTKSSITLFNCRTKHYGKDVMLYFGRSVVFL